MCLYVCGNLQYLLIKIESNGIKLKVIFRRFNHQNIALGIVSMDYQIHCFSMTHNMILLLLNSELFWYFNVSSFHAACMHVQIHVIVLHFVISVFFNEGCWFLIQFIPFHVVCTNLLLCNCRGGTGQQIRSTIASISYQQQPLIVGTWTM